MLCLPDPWCGMCCAYLIHDVLHLPDPWCVVCCAYLIQDMLLIHDVLHVVLTWSMMCCVLCFPDPWCAVCCAYLIHDVLCVVLTWSMMCCVLCLPDPWCAVCCAYLINDVLCVVLSCLADRAFFSVHLVLIITQYFDRTRNRVRSIEIGSYTSPAWFGRTWAWSVTPRAGSTAGGVGEKQPAVQWKVCGGYLIISCIHCLIIASCTSVPWLFEILVTKLLQYILVLFAFLKARSPRDDPSWIKTLGSPSFCGAAVSENICIFSFNETKSEKQCFYFQLVECELWQLAHVAQISQCLECVLK